MARVSEIVAYLEEMAPLSLAEEWDNVGLLMGDDNAECTRLMTCLTVTQESAKEAIDAGAALIISHHPIFFRPTKNLTSQNPENRFLWQLANAGVAVYSPHTAFDNAAGGINDTLAAQIGLTEIAPLRPKSAGNEYKIVVFLPETDFESVANALFSAGAGRIGDYTQCSHRVIGHGTFFGSEETNPAIGQKGRREEVDEWRMEVICSAANVTRAVREMVKAHSYEEPAFDIYPLEPKPPSVGQGRIGKLPKPVALKTFAEKVKSSLKCSFMHVVGKKNAKIRTVALACGAAGEFLQDAIRVKADLFLTGEMRFHDLLRAQSRDIALLVPGHYATERPAVEMLAKRIQDKWSDLKVWASRHERDPLWPLE